MQMRIYTTTRPRPLTRRPVKLKAPLVGYGKTMSHRKTSFLSAYFPKLCPQKGKSTHKGYRTFSDHVGRRSAAPQLVGISQTCSVKLRRAKESAWLNDNARSSPIGWNNKFYYISSSRILSNEVYMLYGDVHLITLPKGRFLNDVRGPHGEGGGGYPKSR